MRFSFITVTNNEKVLSETLLSSPDLHRQVEIIVQRDWPSAATAYNEAIQRARGEILIFLHHDIYLPEGWLGRLEKIIGDLERFGDREWGVLGIYGADDAGEGHGLVYSTGLKREIGCNLASVAEVQTLDEVVLIIRARSLLRFDGRLPSFHLYGADLCLQARERGFKNYAIANRCIHNSAGMRILPLDYWRCYFYIRAKWRGRLPVHTPCMKITFAGWPALHYLITTPLLLAMGRVDVGGRRNDLAALIKELEMRETLADDAAR